MSKPNLAGIRPFNYSKQIPKLVDTSSLKYDLRDISYNEPEIVKELPTSTKLWNYIKNNINFYDILVSIVIIIVCLILYNRYKNRKNRYYDSNFSLKQLIVDFFTDTHSYLN